MMQCKKETHPTAATAGRAEMEAGTWRTTTSTSKVITLAPPGQRVSDYLLPGQQNAVPLKRLKEILDLDGRTVRLMIRAERLSGVPILADNRTGYYLPGDDRERARCVRSMRRRAAEIVRVADAIEGADI